MKAPYFWNAGLDPMSRYARPVTRKLLTPLAALYTIGIRQKLSAARPVKVQSIVICVGNLTVGGVGKTPVVDVLRTRCAAMGQRSASLSRGYGGRFEGPLKVSAQLHTAADVGDEPLMLARHGETWIGRNRLAAAIAMQADGVQVIVMDDGHQNPSLAKDLSLVVVDAAAAFGNGYVLPKGPLREPAAEGLKRAHAVLLVGDGEVPADIAACGLPVLRLKLAPSGPMPEGPLFAFAGIGRPAKFFDTLKAYGGDLRGGIGFDDHHLYTDGELKELARQAAKQGAHLITTPKDHVRLPPVWQVRVLAFPVHAQFDDDAALTALLETRLTRHV
jgi:tetraacyldisaccharide 4'-kinase